MKIPLEARFALEAIASGDKTRMRAYLKTRKDLLPKGRPLPQRDDSGYPYPVMVAKVSLKKMRSRKPRPRLSLTDTQRQVLLNLLHYLDDRGRFQLTPIRDEIGSIRSLKGLERRGLAKLVFRDASGWMVKLTAAGFRKARSLNR